MAEVLRPQRSGLLLGCNMQSKGGGFRDLCGGERMRFRRREIPMCGHWRGVHHCTGRVLYRVGDLLGAGFRPAGDLCCADDEEVASPTGDKVARQVDNERGIVVVLSLLSWGGFGVYYL